MVIACAFVPLFGVLTKSAPAVLSNILILGITPLFKVIPQLKVLLPDSVVPTSTTVGSL